MKTAIAVLLMCVAAVPQTGDDLKALRELNRQMDETVERSKRIRENSEKIVDNFKDINKKIAIRNEIDDEFYEMTSELGSLDDPRVDSVLASHMARINRLRDQLFAVKPNGGKQHGNKQQ